VSEGRLLAGEYPGTGDRATAQARIEAFLRAGADVFVDLTARGELRPYDDLVAPARHIRLPIVDGTVPRSADAMVEILDVIDAQLRDGRLVYVHCLGGIGRTGTVVGCWLARRHGGEEALTTFERLWQQCPKSEYTSSPETDEQRYYILDWEAGR
jgi:predicted protein tyrosine phosphatase